MASTTDQPNMTDTIFDCPLCQRTYRGDMTLNYTSDPEWVPDMEPMWPGGPLAEVWGKGRWVATNRRISTSFCDHSFRTDEWAIEVLTYSDGRPSEFHARIPAGAPDGR